MKKIRSFKCSKSNEVFERMVIDEITIVKCDCGNEAKRCLSAPYHFGNSTGRSPSAARRK